MAQFKVLTKASEWEPFRLGYEARGGKFPKEGTAVMFAQFSDHGDPEGFQFLQNIIAAEGMYSQSPNTNFLKLGDMALEYARNLVGAGSPMLTFTRQDKQGTRVAKVAERKGFQKTNWNVYRREL